MKKILLLGSGELGKEFTIAAQRLGQHVVACDAYCGAPAMQVADECEVFSMLDGEALDRVVEKHHPDLIISEIEAIRTERLYEYEAKGIRVVPSARAVNYTMNRKAIRDLAAKELGIRTARYHYATTEEELRKGAEDLGFPCIVKPLMSSSGKGQSVMRSVDDVKHAFEYGMAGSRGDVKELIVEEFVDFDYEITLLTVTQDNGNTLFCAPIGHVQEDGDYRESWQPQAMSALAQKRAQETAEKITTALGGRGIFGVELFVCGDDIIFNEVSPRPHDTGMVTMASQELSQFALHARAILGLPIPEIYQISPAASKAIVVEGKSDNVRFANLEKVLSEAGVNLRLFGKGEVNGHRRLGVILARDESTEKALAKAEHAYQQLEIQL